MAELTLDFRDIERAQAYADLDAQIVAVLDGIDDPVAAMATISALIYHGLGYLWTGFYRVAIPGKLLRVGPYQGSLGCLEIAFGKGVCGVAAAQGRTVIVKDVAAFPGHITCDARSKSEIVVPVYDSVGELLAVLDIDSDQVGTFTEDDQRGLETIVRWFGREP
ncbi:MAG: GAF domain-containing protein [Gemmatimonadaceae bacterium]